MATAIFIFRKKEYKVNAGMTVRHILEKIGVDSETVIPTRNGELISDDEIVQEGEVIKLVAVISGGSTCTAKSPLWISGVSHEISQMR